MIYYNQKIIFLLIIYYFKYYINYKIVNDFFIAKKDHIFNSINDCVFACYFIK